MSRDCRSLFETAKRAVDKRVSPLGRRVEKAVEERVADVRKRWEESDYDASNALHRLRGQSLVWLFSVGRRWSRADVPLRNYYMSAALALGSLVLATLIHAGALAVLFAGVLISVRACGLRGGLLTTFLCTLGVSVATLHVLHTPAGLNILVALVSFVFVSVLACVLIDSLEVAREEADRQRVMAESTAHRFRFLAEATAMLEAERSYDGILASVTRSIVPAWAHWATADVFREGQLCRLAVSHQDDAVTALLRDIQRNRALSIPEGHPIYEALLNRKARIFANVTQELLAPLQLDYRESRGLMPAHLIFVPLIARHRLLGALTLISTEPDCTFAPGDLVAAQDLALRVGMAMDNLELYQGALYKAEENERRERETAGENSLLELERKELVEQNTRLAVEATTDGLTGLLNHLTFKRALEHEFKRAQRENLPLSVAILDVDRFKSYNDTYGHPAGDSILMRMAAIMKETARASDVVARYGGEEFVIVMPDTDAQGALEAMERLRQAIQTSPWPNRAMTASFGVATFYMGMFVPQELVDTADEALYCSKQAGRNRVTHADMQSEAVVFRNRRASAAIHLSLPE